MNIILPLPQLHYNKSTKDIVQIDAPKTIEFNCNKQQIYIGFFVKGAKYVLPLSQFVSLKILQIYGSKHDSNNWLPRCTRKYVLQNEI